MRLVLADTEPLASTLRAVRLCRVPQPVFYNALRAKAIQFLAQHMESFEAIMKIAELRSGQQQLKHANAMGVLQRGIVAGTITSVRQVPRRRLLRPAE